MNERYRLALFNPVVLVLAGLLLNYYSRAALFIFAAGVIISKGLLAAQGIATIATVYLPAANKLLFHNTWLLVAGAISVFMASCKKISVPDSFYTTSYNLNT